MNYALLFANNANTTLANSITSTATQITVASGTGGIFPTPLANQAIVLTISSATNPLLTEIVLCTAINGDVLTVIRAQENTVARNWSFGDYIANLVTAGTQQSFTQTYSLDSGTYSPVFNNVTMTSGQITNAPVNPTDIVNKAYADSHGGGGTYTAGTGLSLINNQFSITPTGVVTGSYGTASSTPSLTVNAEGQITSIGNTPISISASQINNPIPNTSLANSSITVNGTSISLGGTGTVTANTTNALTIGTGLNGVSFNGSAPVTIDIANTTVVSGIYGSASNVASFTVNAQGQLTAASNIPISITTSQVSGLGTMALENANNVSITGGSIDGTTIGVTTPNTVKGTTITATTQFSGPGTGLTGTASGLSVGSATLSTNISGGLANEIPYQTAPNTTGFITAPTTAGTVLEWNGTSFTWATGGGGGSGTVTSVNVSGGTTGITFTGGPITTSGTITMSGTLDVANGGTGATTLTGYVYGNGTGAFTANPSIPNTSISGLGTLSTQNASSVAITGGTISGVAINGSTIGATTPSTGAFTSLSATTTVTLDNYTGYVYSNGATGLSAQLTIPNTGLTNSSITVNGVPISLGASGTITADTPNSLSFGTGLTTGSFNGSAPTTVSIAPTGVTAGTYGSSASIPVITINAEGQITSVSVQATNAPSYQGTWNASTNTPTLTSGVGTQGYYYVVSVAGNTTLDGVSSWNVGDWAIFENGHWEKIPGSTSESFTNLTTTNLAVTGLTGYMYANGTGNVTASSTIPTTSLSGTITNSQLQFSTISGVALGNNLFSLSAGTGLTGTAYNGSVASTFSIANTTVTAGSYTYGSFTVNAQGQLTAASSNPTTGSGNIVLSNSPTITGAWGSPDSLQFNTLATVTPTVGKLYWDGNSTLNFGMTTNVVQSIGLDTFYYIKASSAITAGQVVMFTGAVGASGVLQGAPATGVTKASYIMGIAAENIAANAFGMVQAFGLVQNLNTSAYAVGDVLYYDPSVVGGLTITEPVAPNVKIQLASVVNVGTGNGSLFVRRQESGTINNITEVQVTSPLNYNLLQYNGTIWQNVSALNGVPVGTTTPSTGAFTTLSGSTITATTQFSGPGTGLTGTASGLSIGGNASTATLSTNISGGLANEIVYQTSANTTSFITAPTLAGQYLEWSGTAFTWASLPSFVSTFSAGTTGLTPATPTSGAVTLAGTLNVVNGGTGLSTLPTNGQLLIGNGTNYSLSTLGSGTGISVTNGAGTISISNTGVTSLTAGTGISLSGSTGSVTVTNAGVTSFSAGTTGLLPSTATTGAITLSGTLAIGNGGTNSTSTPTAGGVAYGDGTAYQFTSAGTSGQVLTSNGAGAPTWATPTGGGAMTLISTQTASSSVNITFSGIPAYNNYLLVTIDALPAASSSYEILFGYGTTPTFITSGYNTFYLFANGATPYLFANGATPASGGSTAQSFGYLNSITATTVASSTHCFIKSGPTHYYYNSQYAFASGLAQTGTSGGSVPAVGQLTAIKIQASSTSITSGTFILYGF